MTSNVSLSAGLLVGFSVAVPIGPMGLLCIQRTLVSGMRIGVSTGLGAATVNVAFGALIILGLNTMAPWMAGCSRLLSALGGLFLLWSAARTLWGKRRMESRPDAATVSPIAAYGSAVMFNAANPMSLIMILALLSPIVGASTPSFAGAFALLLGMFAAAATWWICLSFGVALLRSRLSPQVLLHVNRVAAMLLTFYGAVTLARSAGL